jgi:hypothetical protein
MLHFNLWVITDPYAKSPTSYQMPTRSGRRHSIRDTKWFGSILKAATTEQAGIGKGADECHFQRSAADTNPPLQR